MLFYICYLLLVLWQCNDKCIFMYHFVISDCYVADEIITSRAGVRVRVGNTDAEGRMAMADVLCHLKEQVCIPSFIWCFYFYFDAVNFFFNFPDLDVQKLWIWFDRSWYMFNFVGIECCQPSAVYHCHFNRSCDQSLWRKLLGM